MSGPSGPDLGKILQQAQEVQGRLAAVQRDLAVRRFEGAAGGGMVTVVVTGELRVLEVRIEPGLFAQGDRDMVQDLCAAATNAALANAQEGVREEMQRVTGGLGLPDLSSLGFGPGSTGAGS